VLRSTVGSTITRFGLYSFFASLFPLLGVAKLYEAYFFRRREKYCFKLFHACNIGGGRWW
jgi:hypothetical protein